MDSNCIAFLHYLAGNKVPILGALSVGYLVFVKTMPRPTIPWFSAQTLKTWFYNYTHVLSHQEAYPYPPEDPASPKV